MADIDWGGLIKNYGPAAAYIISQLWGASSQNSANGQNTDAINARNAMLQGYINPMLQQQQGQSPYAAAIASFIGRPGLGASLGTAQNPYPIPDDWRKIRYDPITGQVLPPATHTTHDGQTLPINQPYTPAAVTNNQSVTGATGANITGSNAADMLPYNPGGAAPAASMSLASSNGLGMVNQTMAPPEERTAPDAQQLVQEWTQRMGDPKQGLLVAGQILAGYGDTSLLEQFDQQNEPERQARIQQMLNDPNTRADIRQMISDPTYGTAVGDYKRNAGQSPQFALEAPNQNPTTPGAQSPYGAPNDTSISIGGLPGLGPVLTMPTGLPQNPVDPFTPTTDPLPTNLPQLTPPSGYPQNPADPFTPTTYPVTPNVPAFDPNSPIPGTSGDPSGALGGMYRYNDPGENAFTYTPPTLGTAPQVTGLQGMNAGQDGLLQMMRRGGQIYGDGGGQQDAVFNNSELFKSLEPLDQRLIDRNVSQLRAGTGSLGQRFGTAMAQNEARLREQLGQDVLARNAGLLRDSYESAQNRSLQAGLGLTSALGQSDTLNQQAKLANQGVQAQYGLHAADIANQAGQFNAQQRMGQNQFAAGQGNIYNQFTLGALGQLAGMDQQRFGNQANLISLLAGLPMAQAQPSAYPGALGDISQMAMLFPYLQGILGGGGNRQSTPTGTPTYQPFWPA